MKILETGKTFQEALAAMHDGKFVNHSTWHANRPTGARDFIGPTALGLVKREGEKAGAMAVFTDTGIEIHEWRPSPDEFASKDWQIVELETAPVDASTE